MENGEKWLEMLILRNHLAHTYNEVTFSEAVNSISIEYVVVLNTTYVYLKEKLKMDNFGIKEDVLNKIIDILKNTYNIKVCKNIWFKGKRKLPTTKINNYKSKGKII